MPSAKELFQLAVRVVGLVFLYHGLTNLPGAVLGVFMSLKTGSFPGVLGAGLVACWPLLLAWWLIGGAAGLMRRAGYGGESQGG